METPDIHPIDGLFKEKLGDFYLAPSPQLSKNIGVYIAANYKKAGLLQRLGFYKYGLGFSLVCLICCLYYYSVDKVAVDLANNAANRNFLGNAKSLPNLNSNSQKSTNIAGFYSESQPDKNKNQLIKNGFSLQNQSFSTENENNTTVDNREENKSIRTKQNTKYEIKPEAGKYENKLDESNDKDNVVIKNNEPQIQSSNQLIDEGWDESIQANNSYSNKLKISENDNFSSVVVDDSKLQFKLENGNKINKSEHLAGYIGNGENKDIFNANNKLVLHLLPQKKCNLIEINNTPEIPVKELERWRRPIPFYYGFSIFPEYTLPQKLTISNLSFKAHGYGADFTINYKSLNWIFQTGFSITRYHKNFPCMVNYETMDSVGYYNRVDSVAYLPDPNNQGQFIKQYFTTRIPVFENVEKQLMQNIKGQYTYLGIPLSIGYHKTFKRSEAFIRLGLSISKLIAKNEPINVSHLGDVSIIKTTKYHSEMNKTYQSAFGSMGFTYYFNEKYCGTIEPTFVYRATQPDNFNNKFAIILKSGVIIKF